MPSCPAAFSRRDSSFILVVGTRGTAFDSSHLLSSSVFARALSLSSSSLRRAAINAFQAWKALHAAFLVRPLSRKSNASRASARASRSLAST